MYNQRLGSRFKPQRAAFEKDCYISIRNGAGYRGWHRRICYTSGQRGKKVTVIEPSQGMLNKLKETAREVKLTNINSLCKRWEDVSLEALLELNQGKFDVVLSSHSLYYITDLHRSFNKMNQACKGTVYLFIGCSDFSRKEAYEKFYFRLYKKPLPPRPDYCCLYMVLREIGIEPDIEMINIHIKRPIESLEEYVDKWKEYLDVKELSGDQKEAIEEYLADKIKEENGKLYYDYQYKNALIYWRAGDGRSG
ncbi:MAG: class I SAM-dependent methyltransferase [Deltaproteobacteria bacterium]|nr:class I SAM-dependent methyltransferase [Deltaproteobacteria bacterium]